MCPAPCRISSIYSLMTDTLRSIWQTMEKQRKDKTGKGWGGEGRRVVKNKRTQVGQRKESEKAKEKGDSPLLHFAP